MQCVCAGTTVPVLVIVNISAAGVVRFTIPSVGVVGSLGFHIVSAGVDSQVEGDDGVAAVDIGAFKSVHVFAAFRDSLSVPIEGFASGLLINARSGCVHGDRNNLSIRGSTVVADGSDGRHHVVTTLFRCDIVDRDILLVGSETVRTGPIVGNIATGNSA